MAAKNVKIRISPAVAEFVVPEAGAEKKLLGISSAECLAPEDRLILLFCLAGDRDPVVRESAITAFSSLPPGICSAYLRQDECHPAVLDLIVRHHHDTPGVGEMVANHPDLSMGARQFLERRGGRQEISLERDDRSPQPPQPEELQAEEQEPWSDVEGSGDGSFQDGEADLGQQGEEFLSKYQLAQIMGIAEKIKMALTGDKEWRAILIKDSNKLVSGSVVKNPRITEGEILTILKVGVQNDEIIRLICANKEWVKNYKIRKALVDSPKTPLPNALRYLASLSEKDIAGYAKSKNISTVISTQAKRILLAKKH